MKAIKLYLLFAISLFNFSSFASTPNLPESKLVLFSKANSASLVVDHTVDGVFFKVCGIRETDGSTAANEQCRLLMNHGLSEEDVPLFNEVLEVIFDYELSVRDHTLRELQIDKRVLGLVSSAAAAGALATSFSSVRNKLKMGRGMPWFMIIAAAISGAAHYNVEQELAELGEETNSLRGLTRVYLGEDASEEMVIKTEDKVWKLFTEKLEEVLRNFIEQKYFA